ncbi:hypothetical protein KR038_001214 [Drosophila bunnanda]|nr:hypothetical protein KR038_001214 [Drosophila bunnanda]
MLPGVVNKAAKKDSLNKDSFEETFNENILNQNILNATPFVDSMEIRDTSDSLSLVSAETTCHEEFETQVEVYPVPKDNRFPYLSDWSVLFQPKRLHPRLERLIYWRDIPRSGMIFAGGFTILLAIKLFSILFVIPFVLLHIMMGSVIGRWVNAIKRAASGEGAGHDWIKYEQLVITLPREKVLLVTCLIVEQINDLIGHLKDLFLFKNTYDSFHFSLFLLSLAMLVKMMTGMTIVILTYTFVFTVPKLYELNKLYIDTKLNSMRKNLTIMINKFRVITAQ